MDKPRVNAKAAKNGWKHRLYNSNGSRPPALRQTPVLASLAVSSLQAHNRTMCILLLTVTARCSILLDDKEKHCQAYHRSTVQV